MVRRWPLFSLPVSSVLLVGLHSHRGYSLGFPKTYLPRQSTWFTTTYSGLVKRGLSAMTTRVDECVGVDRDIMEWDLLMLSEDWPMGGGLSGGVSET